MKYVAGGGFVVGFSSLQLEHFTVAAQRTGTEGRRLQKRCSIESSPKDQPIRFSRLFKLVAGVLIKAPRQPMRLL